MLKIFDKYWWRYIFSSRSTKDVSWFIVVWCRLRNHPKGFVWYRSYGDEPDYHCKICGDEL